MSIFDGEPFDGEPFDGEPFDGEPFDGEPFDGESNSQVNPLAARWIDMQQRDSAAADSALSNRQEQPTLRATQSGNGWPWPTGKIWLIGLIGLGLPSICMRPSFATVFRFSLLIISIPASFIFCGPYWDRVLFAGTPYIELGVYPFIMICLCVPFLSVWLGFRDRRMLRTEITESSNEQKTSLMASE